MLTRRDDKAVVGGLEAMPPVCSLTGIQTSVDVAVCEGCVGVAARLQVHCKHHHPFLLK